jgi:hypothetical protein
MIKGSKNEMMKSSDVKNKQQFFFPKQNPPVTIEAETVEEATELLTKKTK